MVQNENGRSTDALMEELCDLLRTVLGRGADSASSSRIDELLSELGRIRIAMERHAQALERVVPQADTLKEVMVRQNMMISRQEQMEAMLSSFAGNIELICNTLKQPAFHEES
ncbi:MAG: hypothetical protein AAGF78_08520 [Pseudomonadota bacterium]